MDEINKVYSMFKVATIELRRSEETGKYYITYICHADEMPDQKIKTKEACWGEKNITNSNVKAFIELLDI